jgi:methylmalonyl-CoA/ethylmalonyl-CoA epimerase
MSFIRIEHIGIAVKNLNESNELIERLFGNAPYKSESVEREGVTTSFFKMGDSKIELVAATNDGSTIAKYIEKKGEGIHHIAFEVSDIIAEMKRLKDAGFQLLHEVPVTGADNKMICFLHPKTTNGILVELTQERK